jgi:hypothetical protein
MTANYVLLEKITVGAAGASSVTFSGIPQTGYTDLVVSSSARSIGTNGVCVVYFNNDTTNANYSVIRLRGTGSTVGSEAYSAPYLPYTTQSNFYSKRIFKQFFLCSKLHIKQLQINFK